jgi:hypothetical protein
VSGNHISMIRDEPHNLTLARKMDQVLNGI